MEATTDMRGALMRNRRLLLVLLALASIMGGCSTFKGEKLGVVTDAQKVSHQVPPSGIPYVLARAEYTLSQSAPAEGQKTGTFSLAVTYEPDPAQWYSIRIDPAFLADPNFTVKLASNGSMLGTNAALTEQLTPLITALGSFASSAVAVAGLHVFDKDSVRNALKPYLIGDNAPAECRKTSDARVNPLLVKTGETVGQEMWRRISGYKDDGEFGDRFHYLTLRELDCLTSVQTALSSKDQRIKQEWEQKQQAHLASHSTDADFVARLAKAVASDDSEQFAALATEANGTPEKEIRADRQKLVEQGKRTAETLTLNIARDQVKSLVGMDPPTWRGRHLLYLENELDRTSLLLLRTNPSDAEWQVATNYVSDVQRERAFTIGAEQLYDRSLVLSDFLRSITKKSIRDGTAPATAEFATARAELDTVLSQIDAKRARVLADAKPAPPAAPPFKPQRVVRVTQRDVDGSHAPGWASGDGKDAPDYVLVLKEAP